MGTVEDSEREEKRKMNQVHNRRGKGDFKKGLMDLPVNEKCFSRPAGRSSQVEALDSFGCWP